MIGYDEIEHYRLSHVGVRRSHNQDSSAVLLAADLDQWREHGHVFLVADGMGGHAVGELASELAASIIPHTYHKYSSEGPGPALRKAFQEANASIHNRGQQNQEFAGMGTTSTTLLLRPEGAWIGHVGDSRAYRIRDQKIQQLSFDHSWIWEMARRQGVAPENLVSEHRNNVIVRSLGPDAEVEVDIEGPYPVQASDIYLMCSDGLSGLVSDEEMGAMTSALPPEEACRLLVHLANLRGGPDNITVMIVRVGSPSNSKHEIRNPKSETDSKSANQRDTENTDTKPSRSSFSWSSIARWFASNFARRVSWTYILLVVGLILAAGAVNLISDAMSRPGKMAASVVVVFVLAIAALLAGSIGLAWHYYRHHRASGRQDQGLHVYNEVDCRVNRPLMERFQEMEKTLAQQLRDNNWEVDWQTNQKHRELAEKALQNAEGGMQNAESATGSVSRTPGFELAIAFREYCRALLPLTDTLELYRSKEEIFQPLWDRAQNRK